MARQVGREGLPAELKAQLLRFSIVDDSDLTLLESELATIETVDLPKNFGDLVDLYAELNADNEDKRGKCKETLLPDEPGQCLTRLAGLS